MGLTTFSRHIVMELRVENLYVGAKEFYLKNPTPTQGAAQAALLGSIENTKP
jgi:hypothetical protein